jgi:hypothetical protein
MSQPVHDRSMVLIVRSDATRVRSVRRSGTFGGIGMQVCA